MSGGYDVCIVGSGAGGGIAAYVLAKAGARVLVLEKGPWLTEEHFGNDELRFGDRTLFDQDPRVEPRTFRNRNDQGDRLYVGKVLGCSQCVGGGSVHYGAVCFRFRPEDFRARTTWGDLPGADLVDWPLTYDDLRPYYTGVERLIGVAGGNMRDHERPGAPVKGAEWREDPYPMPGHPPNRGAHLFEQATRRIGLHPFPTPVAINNGAYDGRPGCSYCGFCSNHGCTIGAKGDTRVTAIAKAVDTGRCTVLPDCNVYRVELDKKGRARSVLYYDERGRTRAAQAKVIVLACGTVDTPRLSLLSELPRDLVNHDVLGRYLQVHHFPGGIGIFDERIEYYRGFWSMRCLDDWYLGDPATGQPAFGFGNLQTVGPSSGYPVMAGGIISTAKTLGWGREHKSAMRNVFGRFQFLGMVGQDPPVRSNMIDLDPDVTDVWGLPAARITYQHHPNDNAVQAAAVPFIQSVLTEMGAQEVIPVAPIGSPTGVPQGPEGGYRRGHGRGLPETKGGLVNHQMGTMRMGSTPDDSVIDRNGRFWGIPNLYVADASVFPTSGGYNPTLTIQAVAWRTAEAIVRGLR